MIKLNYTAEIIIITLEFLLNSGSTERIKTKKKTAFI